MLKPALSGCQVFGHVFDSLPSSFQMDSLQREMLPALLSDLSGFLGSAVSVLFPRINASTLYLDPLYVLFNELKSDDTVFVLDLSPSHYTAWHGAAVSQAYSAAFDRICSKRPNVIAISQNTADTLYANYGFPKEKTRVIPLYVPRHLSDDLNERHISFPAALHFIRRKS